MMESIKALAPAGGGRVGIGEEDVGDGMACSDHPYRNNPGGICAFCLQEKLGKLVSSSFPLPVRGSSSSSSSPSFRSEVGGGNGAAAATTTAVGSSSLALSVRPVARARHGDHYSEYYTRRARIPFLTAKKKKKMVVASDRANDVVFKRSKSTHTPRREQFSDDGGEAFSPRKRSGFWSFLYLSSKSSGSRKVDTRNAALAAAVPREKCIGSSLLRRGGEVVEDDESPSSQATASASSFERKVSRSRSVGCGSRSFSGDFFERISTGFGDCTLRRVESQREGKPKLSSSSAMHRGGAAADHHHHHCMKERVKCGGLFGGFMMTSSSSSSSSSSYWVSSSAEDINGKPASHAAAAAAAGGSLAHGRSKSWGWAFASPMRAFTKPSSSKDGKSDVIIRETSNKNTTPSLVAVPSLLAVNS